MRRMTKKLSVLSHISRYRTKVLLVWLTAVAGSLVALPSYAMPSMQSKDFEVIFASGEVNSECIIDKEYLSSVWDAQLLRARIKNKYRSPALGWLWIALDCVPANHNPEKFLFEIDVVWTWSTDGDTFPEVRLSSMYGVAGEETIRQNVEDRVTDAITEYLKANL